MNHRRCHLPRVAGLSVGGILVCMLLMPGGYTMALPAVVCDLNQHQKLADCPEVSRLLQRSDPPPGVVFEVIENDHNALEQLQAPLSELTEHLKQRHPGLSIEMVSHGNELATLAATGSQRSEFLRWSQTKAVDVVGCQYYAEMRDMNIEQLNENIDLVASATRHLEQRIAEGYDVIRLRPARPLLDQQDPWANPWVIP